MGTDDMIKNETAHIKPGHPRPGDVVERMHVMKGETRAVQFIGSTHPGVVVSEGHDVHIDVRPIHTSHIDSTGDWFDYVAHGQDPGADVGAWCIDITCTTPGEKDRKSVV